MSSSVGPAFLFLSVVTFVVTLQQKKKHTKPADPVKLSKSDENLLNSSTIASNVLLVPPLVKQINQKANDGGIIVIGIAGGSGSGKTTLSKAICQALGPDNITYIQHDSYYKDITHLPIEKREQQNFDHPDSLETELLVKDIIKLKNKEDVIIPTYDFATHSRLVGSQALPSRPVVLVEGILIFSDPALYNLFDVKIFVDTDHDVRLMRRIQRDTVERGRTLAGVLHQYVTTVRPMHMQFVEPSKRNADIIVPEGMNSVALDLVVSRLQSHL